MMVLTDCNRIGSIQMKSSADQYDEEVEFDTMFGFSKRSEKEEILMQMLTEALLKRASQSQQTMLSKKQMVSSMCFKHLSESECEDFFK